MDRVELIEKSADTNGMDAITATSDAYPKNLLDAGRTDALYTMGDVDLNVPTLGLIIGGNSKPTAADQNAALAIRSEEHTSELQSLMRNSYAVFCLKRKNTRQ